MGFMVPDTLRTEWLRIERRGESFAIPAEDYESEPGDEREELGTGWGARLSAPGYLDCTEWDAPYDSERAALEELARTHDMCAHCFGDGCGAAGDSDDDETRCYPALLDSLRSFASIAHGEFLRGRDASGPARSMAHDIRGIRSAAAVDGDATLRDDIRRACACGREDARRSIDGELRFIIRCAVEAIELAADPARAAAQERARAAGLPIAQRLPDVARGARIRFPGLFGGRK